MTVSVLYRSECSTSQFQWFNGSCTKFQFLQVPNIVQENVFGHAKIIIENWVIWTRNELINPILTAEDGGKTWSSSEMGQDLSNTSLDTFYKVIVFWKCCCWTARSCLRKWSNFLFLTRFDCRGERGRGSIEYEIAWCEVSLLKCGWRQTVMKGWMYGCMYGWKDQSMECWNDGCVFKEVQLMVKLRFQQSFHSLLPNSQTVTKWSTMIKIIICGHFWLTVR